MREQLTEYFDDRWMGPNAPWRWSPRSPDQIPLDYYRWRRIRGRVYATPVSTNEDLVIWVRKPFRELSPAEMRRSASVQ